VSRICRLSRKFLGPFRLIRTILGLIALVT
jgi:hypothetical protein